MQIGHRPPGPQQGGPRNPGDPQFHKMGNGPQKPGDPQFHKMGNGPQKPGDPQFHKMGNNNYQENMNNFAFGVQMRGMYFGFLR
ncbi:MAG: hypothetical protein ACLFQV_05605 [Vulcanimicrobiota bacterium]